jgi:4-hydroxybenzoyl-CoA thioesterase
MTFAHTFSITFGDADPAGIAYYPRILNFCHEAFERLFESELGRHYAQVFLGDNVGYPTVRLEVDFRAPMRFGDAMRVEVDVAEVTRRTVTFLYRFVRVSDGTLCAEAKNVTVATDRLRFRAVDVPSDHAAMFRKHLRSAAGVPPNSNP